ncbi:unnamed protein product [Mucor fragilis]
MNANTNFIFEDHRGELGACQVGKAADVISCDEKYFDDRLVTLPMLAAINPDKTNDLCTVGFLVMGLIVEMPIVNVPTGKACLDREEADDEK